jgi:mannose-1-phosphate guanylyltransferase
VTQAVVLVGGEGRRLRPLTDTRPKPMMALVDRPFVAHQIDLLRRYGIDDVIFSCGYRPDALRAHFGDRSPDGVRFRYVVDPEPLGTAGAVKNAEEFLDDAAFLVLNGDILTDLDLTAMLAFHRERGASVTISLTHVEDARPFGLVPTDADGRVFEFLEKPDAPVPGDVNAGTYVLDPSVLHGFARGENLSIERQIFPAVIADGRPVYGFGSPAYWMDLGTPEKYLQGHFDIFEGKVGGLSYPSPWVHETARIDLRSHLGRWVAAGAGVEVAEGAQIDDAVLLPGAHIGAGARVIATIAGPNAQVGAGATVAGCVLGEGAAVPDGAVLRDQKVPAQARG